MQLSETHAVSCAWSSDLEIFLQQYTISTRSQKVKNTSNTYIMISEQIAVVSSEAVKHKQQIGTCFIQHAFIVGVIFLEKKSRRDFFVALKEYSPFFFIGSPVGTLSAILNYKQDDMSPLYLKSLLFLTTAFHLF